MSEVFQPNREVKAVFGERSVRIVTDGHEYGLELTNGAARTRCRMSREAMLAVVNGFSALAAGRGENIKFEWIACPDHTVLNPHQGEQ